MSRPGTFVQARLAELPPRLDGPNGQGCAAAQGQLQDDEQAIATDAVLMRYPPRTPNDALDILGACSGPLTRFPNEKNGTVTPPAGYHGRLVARWAIAKKKGSAQGIIDSLNGYGIVDVAILQDFEDPYFVGENYARFQVLLGPDMGALAFAPLVAPFTPDAEGTITGGSTATIFEVRAIKLQILALKSAHSYPVRVTLDLGIGVTCKWDIGKLCTENITRAPFTPGGYQV